MNIETLPPPTEMSAKTSRATRVSRRWIIAALLLATSVAAAAKADHNPTVKIMTQNMDAGTDLLFIVATGGAPCGVDLTRAEIVASNIPVRVDLIADQIVAEQPDIVALQEVILWRTGPTIATTTQVLFDQLGALLAKLAARGTPYEVAAVNSMTDVALPDSAGEFLRYTDRDVLLTRAGLRPPEFNLTNVHTHLFSTALDFNGLPILQGWISAEVHVGNRHFRLIATHLQSAVDGIPVATEVQLAQTNELLRSLRNVTVPVVLCGDFNSDAEFGGFLDTTPSVNLITAAGYTECWKLLHPGNPGYTWPLFLQDQYPPPFFTLFAPYERIDLFFAKGLPVTSVERVVAPAPAGTMPPYGSDHAGVVATFQL